MDTELLFSHPNHDVRVALVQRHDDGANATLRCSCGKNTTVEIRYARLMDGNRYAIFEAIRDAMIELHWDDQEIQNIIAEQETLSQYATAGFIS